MYGSSSLRSTLLLAASLALAACATPEPVVEKVDARPLQPRAGEKVVVDDLLVIIDSSASLDDGQTFYEERALVESFVASTPDGRYEAGAVAFGGFDRYEIAQAPHDRARLASETSRVPYLKAGTPLHKVLAESQDKLGSGKRAAVVIFSDGEFTDEFGRDVGIERVVASARALDESYPGTVCFHTVQVGESAVGAEMLREVSQVTSCGTTRSAAQAASESQLHAMHRDVFIGAAPVAAKKPALPPVSAPAPSAQTSWSVNFGLDSARVQDRYRKQFGEIANQLQANPDARIVITGHTDTSGNAEYNRALSLRRAEATKDGLVQAGVNPQRIEIQGFGADSLRFPDTSDENRAANRRTEIELVR